MNYVDLVTKRFNSSRSNLMPWFTKFDRWYSLYRNYQQIKNYYGRSNLFVPASFWTVESYVPRLFRSLRDIMASPTSDKDTQNAKSVTALLKYQKEEIGFDDFLKSWIRGAGIYGMYPAKVSWEYDPVGNLDKPRLDLVDKLDFFYDPNAIRIEDCRWIIHRTQKHIDELLSVQKKMKYKNLDKIMPRGTPPQDEGFKARRKSILSVVNKPYDSSAKMVDIYEMWGYCPTNEDPKNYREENMIITIANKNTVIKEELNPMADILPGNALPFVNLYDTDVLHEFEGIGEIEPIESLQNELNDTRNQRMDNVTLVINRMFEVIRSADVSEDDFTSLPGKVFYSNIPNGVREITTPDVTQSAYEEEKLIKEDIQQTTTGTANVDIPSINKSETATGILAVQEAGDTRTEYKVLNMKNAVKKLWRIILALDQKLITKDYIIKIEGQQGTTFQTLTPEQIKGNFDIDVEVESQQNRLVKKQERMQLYQLGLKTPGANVGQMFKDVLEIFDVPNPDAYYQEPQPQPPQPSISISLRGELAPMEVDEFSKIAGAGPTATDPILRPEFRRLMFPHSKEPPLPDEHNLINEAAQGMQATQQQQPAGEMQQAAQSAPAGAPANMPAR